MKEITLQIPEGKKAEWINGVLTLVDDKPKDITKRIKTFEDACEELGEEHTFVKEWKSICDATPDIEAYLKLRIICAALNEGWEPSFNDNEIRWFPFFNVEKQGNYLPVFSYMKSINSSTLAHVSSRLYFKSEELADYCGEQFIDIWQDYLLTRND